MMMTESRTGTDHATLIGGVYVVDELSYRKLRGFVRCEVDVMSLCFNCRGASLTLQEERGYERRRNAENDNAATFINSKLRS